MCADPIALPAPALGHVRAASSLAPRDASAARPTIIIREQLNEVVREAEDALLADPDAGVYVRGRNLVRVTRDSGVPRGGMQRPEGSPVVEPLSLDALAARLDQAARWVRLPRNAPEREMRPPEWVTRGIMALDAWGFPPLAGVVEAPAFVGDGRVVDRAGYDAASGLLLIPSQDFPPVPARPAAADVKHAIDLLLEVFCDFPFVAESDRAAAVALPLTLLSRSAIAGPVPMFTWRATAPASGKNLGVDAAAVIATGRPAPRMVLPAHDEELRKLTLAVAVEGTSLVLIDNIDRPLGSHTLAAALTAEDWSGRLLGSTATARAQLRATWCATGNGLMFRGDLARRVVVVDLDPRCEHPEDRTGFRHPDLGQWVREHRASLVVAGLTILRAFDLAGRPAHGLGPRMGSFEHWDDLVRGACAWAGIGDVIGGRDRVRSEDDGDLLALRAALSAWREAFTTPRTAAEAVHEAESRAGHGEPALRDALLGLTPHREKPEARALGNGLRRLKARVCDGACFATAGEDRNGVARWTVRDVRDVRDVFAAVDGPCAGSAGSAGSLFSYAGENQKEGEIDENTPRIASTPRTPDTSGAAATTPTTTNGAQEAASVPCVPGEPETSPEANGSPSPGAPASAHDHALLARVRAHGWEPVQRIPGGASQTSPDPQARSGGHS